MSNTGADDHHEESSPLLSKQVEDDGSKGSCNDKGNQPKEGKVDAAPDLPDLSVGVGYGWTAEGLLLGHGNVVDEPMARGQWNTCLFACLGRNDEFCSTDIEVCLLGSIAPCVLYGSNAERLRSGPDTFPNCCLLELCLAPCFSYPRRTAMRRKFNLEEGREIRRSIPHPTFIAQPLLDMIPPGEQTMGGRA
ncbi:hypothetical protein SLEP1_g23423 [Rubroshorea leprosula]|uniref:Uncharacterized protein n=1 Tax=Rubroshorea leprosula TaxID=152421 RepID=A0AAV5JFD5_9ROSI|nr:hypothetical protein SLEP1_g23423 [Rubroshorea leprosula]